MIVLFKCLLSLLIFGLDILPIIESRLLKSPTVIVDWTVYPLITLRFCFLLFVYTFIIVISSWFINRFIIMMFLFVSSNISCVSVLFDINIAISAHLCLLLTWYNFLLLWLPVYFMSEPEVWLLEIALNSAVLFLNPVRQSLLFEWNV